MTMKTIIKISQEQKSILRAAFDRFPSSDHQKYHEALGVVSMKTGLREEVVKQWFDKRRRDVEETLLEVDDIQILDHQQQTEPDSALEEEKHNEILVDNEEPSTSREAASVSSTSGPDMSNEEKAAEYDTLREQIEKMKRDMMMMTQSLEQRQQQNQEHQFIPEQQQFHSYQRQQQYHHQLPYPGYGYNSYHQPQMFPHNPYSPWHLPYPPPDFQILILPHPGPYEEILIADSPEAPTVADMVEESADTAKENDGEHSVSQVDEHVTQEDKVEKESQETKNDYVNDVSGAAADNIVAVKQISVATNDDKIDMVSEEPNQSLISLVDDFENVLKADNNASKSEESGSQQDQENDTSPKKKYRLTPFKNPPQKDTADLESTLSAVQKDLEDFENSLDSSLDNSDTDGAKNDSSGVEKSVLLNESSDESKSADDSVIIDDHIEAKVDNDDSIEETTLKEVSQLNESMSFDEALDIPTKTVEEVKATSVNTGEEERTFETHIGETPALDYEQEELVPDETISSNMVKQPTPFIVKKEPEEPVKNLKKVGRKSLIPSKSRPIIPEEASVNQEEPAPVSTPVQHKTVPPSPYIRAALSQPSSQVMTSDSAHSVHSVQSRRSGPLQTSKPQMMTQQKMMSKPVPMMNQIVKSPALQQRVPHQQQQQQQQQQQPTPQQQKLPQPQQQRPRLQPRPAPKRKAKEPGQVRTKAAKVAAPLMPQIANGITVTKVVESPKPQPPPAPVFNPASRPELQRIMKMQGLSISIKR